MGPTRVTPGSHLGQDHDDADGNRPGLVGEHVKSQVPVPEAVAITSPAGSVPRRVTPGEMANPGSGAGARSSGPEVAKSESNRLEWSDAHRVIVLRARNQ